MPKGFLAGRPVTVDALFLKENVQAKTAAVAVSAAERGKTFTNEGATAQVVFTLPTAALGLEYRFVVADTDGIQIVASAGDTIRVAAGVSSVAGTATNAAIGSVLKLVAINATQWIGVEVQGTWTLA